jgi:hypothetical protein
MIAAIIFLVLNSITFAINLSEGDLFWANVSIVWIAASLFALGTNGRIKE